MKFDIKRWKHETEEIGGGWYANIPKETLRVMDTCSWGRDTVDYRDKPGFKTHFSKFIKLSSYKYRREALLHIGIDNGINFRLIARYKKFTEKDIENIVYAVLEFVAHYGKNGYITFDEAGEDGEIEDE